MVFFAHCLENKKIREMDKNVRRPDWRSILHIVLNQRQLLKGLCHQFRIGWNRSGWAHQALMAKHILKLAFRIKNTLSNEPHTFVIVDGRLTCHIMKMHRKPTSYLYDADCRQLIRLLPSWMSKGRCLATFMVVNIRQPINKERDNQPIAREKLI
jgi:hypothetical protein